MTKLTVHYEGWVALPAAFRRRLRIERGDQLEAELVDGTIILRVAGAKGTAAPVEEEPASAEAAPLMEPVPAPPALATQVEAAPPPKRRGRLPKAKG